MSACRDNTPGDPFFPEPITTGNIAITVEPDSLPVEWTLVGPGDYIHLGQGSEFLPGLELGSYTIQWGEETCWARSGPDTITAAVTVNDTLTFANSYAPQQGGCGRLSIYYNFAPDDYNSLEVPWSLDSPGIFHLDGEGEKFLDMVPPGPYTITWETPPGFLLLFGQDSATLVSGAVEILDATFAPDYSQMGTIIISIDPADLNRSWALSGPGKNWSGSSGTTIEHVVPGHYHLFWEEIPNWSQLNSLINDQYLEPNQTLSFAVTFRTDSPLAVPGIDVHPGPEPGQIVVSWQWLVSSGNPIVSYLVATDTNGPITTDNWSQARLIVEQPPVPDQELYSLTLSTQQDGLLPEVSNWFAVRAMDSAGQLSPVEGQWSTIPTLATIISGHVFDHTGQPLAGIPLDYFSDDIDPQRAVTDQAGAFTFPTIFNNTDITLTTVTNEMSPGVWFDYSLPLMAGSPLVNIVLPLIPRHEMDANCLLATPDFLTYLRAMTNTDYPANNRPNTKLFKWDHWPLTVYLPADNTPQAQDFQALSRSALGIWNDTMSEEYFIETTDPVAADVVFVYSGEYPTMNGQVSILEPAGGYYLGEVIPQKMEVYLHDTLNTDQRVTEVALHELGHVIGIADHSQCSGAGYLMYITSGGVLDNGPEHAIHPDEQELVTTIRHLPQGLDMAGFTRD